MSERFPDAADRVHRALGLRLPRHLAVFAALWESSRLNRGERNALTLLAVRPWGLTEYLLGGGTDDPMHARFRRDPAEFVTVMSGGTLDGSHYGLWYDDPAELPSFVVHNAARASAETLTDRSPTLLAQLRVTIDRTLDDYPQDSATLRPLSDALDAFAGADREAQFLDGEPRWSNEKPASTAISVFPALPPDAGDPQLARSNERLMAFRELLPEARTWITAAESELAAGHPALALAVGGELHWLDRDDYRHEGHALLTGAYRALGRHALATIADHHAAHRTTAPATPRP